VADFLDPLPLNIKLTDDTGPLDYCSCNLRFTISGQGRKLNALYPPQQEFESLIKRNISSR